MLSTNYFDIHSEYFVISSDNLDSVRSNFFGYVIQNNGIFERSNIELINDELSRCGSYVHVQKKSQQIHISQDSNASYGLYLFKHNDFFAISNSFMYLLDYVKDKFPLTFNQDFANYMQVVGLCSEATNETPVKEITILDKDAHVTIDIKTNTITVDIRKQEIGISDISSSEGMQILDNWFVRWTRLFRNISSKTNNISIELSGGFDSRLTFMLFLMSGLDLNKTKVISAQDELHKEDFLIASKIAERFNFKLNCASQHSEKIHLSLQDMLNMSIYNRLPFHKELIWKSAKEKYKFYTITGSGGENIRSYWNFPIQSKTAEYLKQIEQNYPWAPATKHKLTESVLRIANSTYDTISRKYQTNDISRFLYGDTRSCRHFGSGAVLNFFINAYWLSPLLDPELQKLKLHDALCNDNNLLVAVIFMRYCPELLDFDFEGNRFIDKDTIAYARKLVEKFPPNMQELLSDKDDKTYTVDVVDQNIINTIDTNDIVTREQVDNLCKSLFLSDECQSVLSFHFDKSIFHFAEQRSKFSSWYPLRQIYPLIADYIVLKSIETKRIEPFQWFSNIHLRADTYKKIIESMTRARIDIKSEAFDIIDVSDECIKINYPAWLQTEGKGAQIESNAMTLDIKIMPHIDGKLTVCLRGIDMRDNNSKRIPYWIDYRKFCCNDETIFDETKPAWHDQCLTYSFNVKKNHEVSLHLEWQPHTDNRPSI